MNFFAWLLRQGKSSDSDRVRINRAPRHSERVDTVADAVKIIEAIIARHGLRSNLTGDVSDRIASGASRPSKQSSPLVPYRYMIHGSIPGPTDLAKLYELAFELRDVPPPIGGVINWSGCTLVIGDPAPELWSMKR